MRPPDIDLTRLYIGDYVADTMDLTAGQHTVLQKLLLQLWLHRPLSLTPRWLRNRSGLNWSDWRVVYPLLAEPLETAHIGVHRWNEAIKAYDGQRLPPFDWQILRTIVLVRDGYTCVYCGSTQDLHADHRISIALGGSNALENLVTACGPCNYSKGPKSLDTWLASRETGDKPTRKTLVSRS